MKIIKIYANKQFKNLEFDEGLNVIIGKIFDKSKSESDTHNLGKSLLISVIDFLMLKKIDKKKFILGKDIFQGQVFFTEILLNNGNYLIIRRNVVSPTKISFKLNDYKLKGFLQNFEWDIEDLPIDKAQQQLNEYLEFDVLTKWSYRKTITYFLRTQQDYLDVYKLNKFKGKDKNWKPMVFNLLGFNGDLIKEKSEFEEEQSKLKEKIKTLQTEAKIKTSEKDKILGLLDIKRDEKNKTSSKIDKFNFFEKDKSINKELVENLDANIQILNTQRYSIEYDIEKINSSLALGINSIDLQELEKLFKEVNIYFPDNLSYNYQQLIQFNESITKERNKILKENLIELKKERERINQKLYNLEEQKEEFLFYLTQKDVYSKFKESQKQLAQIEAEILRLDDKLKAIDNVSHIEERLEEIDSEIQQKIKAIKLQIDEQCHAEIRKIFNSIINKTLNVPAIISISQNKNGNVDFKADYQSPEDLEITAESFGTTYKKFLCMAFDLSVLIYYSKNSFFRFVYHDGALEGIDDRKKINFINTIREICLKHNIQHILTLIDSDLPKDENNNVVYFLKKEICLELNDKDDKGRLFEISF